MEKDFEDYIHNARNEFVDAVNTYVRNKQFRVKCEDILLAFDQLKWKLRESQKLSTSDEALPIADVSGSDNHTRFYIPTDHKKTNSLMVVLDKTLVTTNPHREMFNEKTGDKSTQFVTGTLDPETGELKLVFFVDRLKEFVSGL